MKTTFRYIISIAFGLFFLLVGTGLNVVHFCCHECEDEGIENVMVETCNTIHHHKKSCCDTHETSDMACSDIQHHPDSCHLTRLNVEITTLSSVYTLDTNFNYKILLFVNNQDNTSKLLLANTICSQLPPPDEILILQGRDILTAKAVLLI